MGGGLAKLGGGTPNGGNAGGGTEYGPGAPKPGIDPGMSPGIGALPLIRALCASSWIRSCSFDNTSFSIFGRLFCVGTFPSAFCAARLSFHSSRSFSGIPAMP